VKREAVLRELREVFGPRGVLWEAHHLLLYEYDASIDKGRPDFVVFPTSTEQVVAAVRIANRYGLPIVVRGAGTGLSGGAVADQGGLMIVTTRMRRILEIDPVNMRAVVQPGVVNLAVSQAAAAYGLYYAPDPSSQKACTIGGNVAENSGGPHCLAYGVTTHHVLGLEIVLPDGEVIEVGGAALDWPGYDLTGLIVGSEGTLGIVTKAILRLLPQPEAVVTLLAVFDTVDQASEAVSAIIADGTIPGAIEMMDRTAIQAVESAKRCGYPTDAGAVLLIDVEGLTEGLEDLAHHIARICEHYDAREVRVATDPVERERLWSGRKGAFGAMGRLAPSYYVQDGVVPRDQLPQVLRRIQEIGQRYGLVIANVFHAGDGNLHPLILFDERDPEQTRRVLEAGAEILRACVEAGGSLTGEHGIGLEKRDLMPLLFSPADLEAMARIKAAFNPENRLNPCKMFPSTKMCLETWSRRRARMAEPIRYRAGSPEMPPEEELWI
jgi:glycolate oxidase